MVNCAEDEVVLEGACEKVVYINDMSGSHHGQTDHTLAVLTKRSWPIKPGLEEKELIGYVDYSLFEGKVFVAMIQVLHPYRRQGWGTKIVKYLQGQYPNNPINWGYSTDEGTQFIESLK